MGDNKLIINTEVFLQCHGHCSGCFLNDSERNELENHLHKIKEPLLNILKKNVNKYSHYIIGFGRGNLLNMNMTSINNLLDLMKECESVLETETSPKITFEVSTSLIGKINNQIEKAKYIIEKNKNVYFNVVINSEVTSEKFWENWNTFRVENIKVRQNFLDKNDDESGDILVLNINPKNLPDIDFIYNKVKDVPSPVNVSMFPFSVKDISNDDLYLMNKWTEKMFNQFSHLDLNISEFLKRLNSYEFKNIDDVMEYHRNTLNAYYFIDKNGNKTSGSLSIMGEVDFVRLLEKFKITPDLKGTWKKMQGDRVCSSCDYQNQCLLSGAYLNMLANSQYNKENKTNCWSGYKNIFEKVDSEF